MRVNLLPVYVYACVHDSASISRPTLIKFGYIDLFCQEKEQDLPMTQPEVIYAHVRNLTSDILTNLL